MSTSATEMFRDMAAAIYAHGYVRKSADASSPNTKATLEAAPGSTFVLGPDPYNNLVKCKDVDLKWAVANVLQFFAATEDAGWLRKYNKHADRFLTGDQWIGAYGAIVMPQLKRCIDRLTASPDSRRAYVDMGPLGEEDLNRPACWNILHFLVQHNRLHMQVYQRSLNLFGVMPYDCIVLTNIQIYMARRLGKLAGCLTWTIGSLHCLDTDMLSLHDSTSYPSSLVLGCSILSDPVDCKRILQHPNDYSAGHLLYLRD